MQEQDCVVVDLEGLDTIPKQFTIVSVPNRGWLFVKMVVILLVKVQKGLSEFPPQQF